MHLTSIFQIQSFISNLLNVLVKIWIRILQKNKNEKPNEDVGNVKAWKSQFWLIMSQQVWWIDDWIQSFIVVIKVLKLRTVKLRDVWLRIWVDGR